MPKYDYSMFAGEAKVLTLPVTEIVDGAALEVDLTGGSSTYVIAATPGGASLVKVAASVSGSTVRVELAPADTRDIGVWGKLWHQCNVEDSEGKPSTVRFQHGHMFLWPSSI